MREEALKQYMLDNWNRLSIFQDEDSPDPREWDNIWKLCIREHRNYDFPNELNFDFSLTVNEKGFIGWEKELEDYYIFALDCYEHSWISFSLSWQGMQCQFDTSKDCGFIAIPKEFEGIKYTEIEAQKIAEDEIKTFNKYMNWETYWRVLEKKVQWTSEDWRTEDRWEQEDSCRWYFELDDIVNEFKDLNPKKI